MNLPFSIEKETVSGFEINCFSVKLQLFYTTKTFTISLKRSFFILTLLVVSGMAHAALSVFRDFRPVIHAPVNTSPGMVQAPDGTTLPGKTTVLAPRRT